MECSGLASTESGGMTAEEAVAFAEELARIGASGGGAAALASCLARRTGTAVLVRDAERRRIAAAGPLEDAAPLATAQIRAAGGSSFGELAIFGKETPDSIDLLLRLTASALSLELGRGLELLPGRRRVFWERLAAGTYIDGSSARDDALARGIAAASHYVAIVLEAESTQESNPEADRAALRVLASESLHGGAADVGVLERGNGLAFFVPAPREVDAANARTAATLFPRGLTKKHAHLRAAGGVGTRVAMTDVPASLAQAQTALTIARRIYGEGRIGVYEDLGVYPLLFSGGETRALRAFAARTLAPLRAYDEKHQTELERTLRVYFECGENVKTAASRLFVHRHTVFYRLRQIGEICACKLNDPHDQLTLRMAMAIDALTTERT